MPCCYWILVWYERFGSLLGSVAAGGIVGSLVGGIIGVSAAKWGPVVAMGLSSLYVLCIMPESLREQDRITFTTQDTNPLQV
jgi:hypothetical protein